MLTPPTSNTAGFGTTQEKTVVFFFFLQERQRKPEGWQSLMNNPMASFIDYFYLYLHYEGQLPAEVNPKLSQVHPHWCQLLHPWSKIPLSAPYLSPGLHRTSSGCMWSLQVRKRGCNLVLLSSARRSKRSAKLQPREEEGEGRKERHTAN